MATKREIKNRWKTDKGLQKVNELTQLLEQASATGRKSGSPQGHPTISELREVVAGLEFSDEVADYLDLRGFPFKMLLCLSQVDFSGARFHHAVLGGNLTECQMVGSNFDGIDGVNLIFDGDFSNASFVRACIKGTCFMGSKLSEADFTRP